MNKKSRADTAIRNSNTNKRRKSISNYWLRKSVHIRLLPKTYNEIRKFAIDENIALQGIMEFFFCKLLDKDENAEKILSDYRLAFKRKGSYVSTSDIDDILEVIEANSPLNDLNSGIDSDDKDNF